MSALQREDSGNSGCRTYGCAKEMTFKRPVGAEPGGHYVRYSRPLSHASQAAPLERKVWLIMIGLVVPLPNFNLGS